MTKHANKATKQKDGKEEEGSAFPALYYTSIYPYYSLFIFTLLLLYNSKERTH
jgi:hypothetical protein